MFLILFLLLIELIAFTCAEIYLLKRDLAYAFYFGALYLYSTPAMIGYYFFPRLSIKLSAHFGEEYWIKFYVFIVASLFFFFIFSINYIKLIRQRQIFHKRKYYLRCQGLSFYIAFFFILLSDGIQLLNLIINTDKIGYMVSTRSNAITFLSGILFGIDAGILIMLYYCIRSKKYSSNKNMQIIIIFIVTVIVFLWYGIKAGNRHVLLQLVIGILFVEIKLEYLNKKTFLIYCIVLLCLLMAFHVLRSYRSNGVTVAEYSMIEKLLSNDYYPPAHMLFTAIYYDVVNPIMVVKSNVANSFFGLGVDYLQKGLMERIVSIQATRNESYALYVFAEGYMFMGKLGFLYNGFVTSTLLYLWRRIATTSDRDYTSMLTAIMVGYSVDLARVQTSYFIKTLWVYILPCILLYMLLVGTRRLDE